jgi:hypothetical protein
MDSTRLRGKGLRSRGEGPEGRIPLGNQCYAGGKPWGSPRQICRYEASFL